MAWRYFARRMNGDGTSSPLHPNLPLTDVEITKQLSGPDQLVGSIPLAFRDFMADDGQPLLREWSTAIFAEADGVIRAGTILTPPEYAGSELKLEGTGFWGYPQGQAYLDSWMGVEIDPLDVVRHIWSHLQGAPGGNLGFQIDATKTPVKIGKELEVVQFQTGAGEGVSFEAGPIQLNWWTTDDLGKEIDDLAADTPFDYFEEHVWVGDEIRHRGGLAYPMRGRRRTDLRFVLGENVVNDPSMGREDDREYANTIMGVGKGEGRDSIHSDIVTRNDGRLRRAITVLDQTRKTKSTANAMAKQALAVRLGRPTVTSLVVLDHPNARVGSWVEGDEIRIKASTDWLNIDEWARIVSTTIYPEKPDIAKITLAPTELAVA